jgi:hypothetical protein
VLGPIGLCAICGIRAGGALVSATNTGNLANVSTPTSLYHSIRESELQHDPAASTVALRPGEVEE